MPSALFRSAPSSNVVITIESAEGVITAAPSPWIALNVISTLSDQASPQNSDAIVNTMRPMTNTRRRPNRSANRPARRRKPPYVIA